MLRRVIGLVMATAVAAGVMVAGGTAQAGTAGKCDNFPGTSTDARRELTICSHIDTFIIGGTRYAKGFGEVRIGSLWATSATGCKISTGLTLSNGSTTWPAPPRAKPYSICTPALTNRNTWSHGPVYQTETTATLAFSTTCIDLFFNNSPTPGWTRCVNSSAVAW